MSATEKRTIARLLKHGERKARYLLFTGKGPRRAAAIGKLSADKIAAISKELAQIGAGPDSKGPYTSEQAAAVLSGTTSVPHTDNNVVLIAAIYHPASAIESRNPENRGKILHQLQRVRAWIDDHSEEEA